MTWGQPCLRTPAAGRPGPVGTLARPARDLRRTPISRAEGGGRRSRLMVAAWGRGASVSGMIRTGSYGPATTWILVVS